MDATMDKVKILNDPVYGTIEIPLFLMDIIDTPEFQRLRHIKQLGVASYVYPGAQHTRFEHSIGTAYLANKLLCHLMRNQNELPDNLRITSPEAQAVIIAALCHDLGHGPFSRLYQDKYMKKANPKKNWTHEKVSWKITKRILERLRLDKKPLPPQKFDRLIKGVILAPITKEKQPGEPKWYIYEFLSGKDGGVNVSKWDRIARDSYYLGIANSFDHERYIKFLRVRYCNDDKLCHICVKDKEEENLLNMHEMDMMLHKKAYHHPGVNAVGHMICDVMLEAERGLKPGEKLANLPIDQFITHDDRSIKPMEESSSGTKRIMKRLHSGKRYRFARQRYLKKDTRGLNENRFITSISKINPDINKTMLRVSICKFVYGSVESPTSFVWSKNFDEAVMGMGEQMTIQEDEQTAVQVFAVDLDREDEIRSACDKLFEEYAQR